MGETCEKIEYPPCNQVTDWEGKPIKPHVPIDMSPEEWQERHAPTEVVLVKIDNKRNTELCRRRKADARLFDAMDCDQERAAAWIVLAFESITGPVAVKVQRFDFMPGGEKVSGDFVSDARHAYVAWGQQCFREGISHTAVMDILTYGLSARQTDKKHRKRKGWALANLIDGLTLFCKLQGWKAHPTRA